MHGNKATIARAKRHWLHKSALIILIGALITGLIYGAAWLTYRQKNQNIYASLPVMEVPRAQRVLLIAPHNDDEVLTNSILSHRLKAQGSDIYVAIITNGDGFTPDIMLSSRELVLRSSSYLRLGLLRQQETIAGLRMLGILEDRIRFFGYPDRGCSEILQYHWEKAAPYFDPWTKSSVVPYENSYGDMPPLAGESIVSDLVRMINEAQPDLIIMPHPGDQNVDHAALSAFTQVAIGRAGLESTQQLLYLTHHSLNSWPQQIYPPNAGPYLVPPADMLDDPGTSWMVLPITKEEKQLATDVIDQYRSQLIVDNAFLHSFVRDNQLFATAGKHLFADSGRAQAVPDEDSLIIEGSPLPLFDRILGSNHAIEGIYGELTSDGLLHLMLNTKGPVIKDAMYQIMLLLDNGVDKGMHVTITFQNGRMYVVGGDYQVEPVRVDGDYVECTIPYAEFAEIRTFLLSGAVSDYERTIDQTTWQSIEMAQPQ